MSIGGLPLHSESESSDCGCNSSHDKSCSTVNNDPGGCSGSATDSCCGCGSLPYKACLVGNSLAHLDDRFTQEGLSVSEETSSWCCCSASSPSGSYGNTSWSDRSSAFIVVIVSWDRSRSWKINTAPVVGSLSWWQTGSKGLNGLNRQDVSCTWSLSGLLRIPSIVANPKLKRIARGWSSVCAPLNQVVEEVGVCACCSCWVLAEVDVVIQTGVESSSEWHEIGCLNFAILVIGLSRGWNGNIKEVCDWCRCSGCSGSRSCSCGCHEKKVRD